MSETVEIILSFLISIILFFIFPIYVAYEKKDDLSYALSTKYVSDFVEEVKIKGYISADMYNNLRDKLISTGNLYDIYLEHKAVKVYPNGSGEYQRVEELYTEKQILSELGIDTFKNNIIKWRFNEADIKTVKRNTYNSSLGESDSVKIYVMNIGDEFTVRIKNNNTTIASMLFNTFTTSRFDADTTRIYVNYGAVITAEKYWNIGG